MKPIKLKLTHAIAVANTLAENVPSAIPVSEQKINPYGRKGKKDREPKRQITRRKRKKLRKHQKTVRVK